ncbi:MAG: S1 RNA-binding domain-containing protein, partial [Clostridiaceae bacterium]|nr:S1 RNA-binding domain-containing protein [Clostridiaceae bacterium]
VGWREKNGPFPSRAKLLDVPQLGPCTFEQCAGFLRIPGAANPLDNTAVHPESYQNVEQLSRMMGILPSPALADRARQQNAHDLAAKLGLGVLTLSDILEALSKPGRDTRDDLPQPTLRSDVLDLQDLKPGMILHGVVRNVADFGAFVDVGVHQDGLVHISEMADHFVKNPHGLVNAGQPVKVRVLRIDPDRRRISLSMKDLDQP